MPLNPTFVIRPISLEKGFELHCDSLSAKPLCVCRLIEAVLAAAQMGQWTDAEVQILNTQDKWPRSSPSKRGPHD